METALSNPEIPFIDLKSQYEALKLAFFQCHDGLFVSCANDGINLPLAHLLAIFNVSWSLADRTAIGDLSTPVTPG